MMVLLKSIFSDNIISIWKIILLLNVEKYIDNIIWYWENKIVDITIPYIITSF